MPPPVPDATQQNNAQAFSDAVLKSARHVGVIFLDEAGMITGWSEGCRFMIGFDADEVLGRHLSLIFTEQDQALRLDEHELRSARELGAAEDERWHVRKDGSRFWASGLTLPLVEAGELRGYVKTFKDATPLRVRLKTLENELHQAAKSSAERQAFLAAAAHELRNPLGTLKSVAQLLARQGAGAQGRPLLEILDRQLGLMERLVEDLVDFARIEAGRLRLAYQPVRLQGLVELAVQACRDRAEARGVALGALLPEIAIDVEVDPDRLQQVLVNLLNNAIKFTPRAGSVVALANVDQSHFVVHVKDSGVGISTELLPRIFDMFTQADGAGSQRGDGLGVGLALAKEIVSLHQGSIEVRSEGRDKGSEFIVRIPLLRPDGSRPEAAVNSAGTAPPP